MNIFNCECGSRMRDLAPLVLRVATGLVFAYHGWQKVGMGVDGVAGMLGSLGFPAPAVFAVLLIAAELGGGILLILGAFTHWVAKILAFVALVAWLTVHAPNGFSLASGGYEFIMLLFAASVSLAITGAGKWSVDRMWLKRG